MCEDADKETAPRALTMTTPALAPPERPLDGCTPAVNCRGCAATNCPYTVAGEQPSDARHVTMTVAVYCTPLTVGREMEVAVVLRENMVVELGARTYAKKAPQGACTFHWVLAMDASGNTVTKYRALVTGKGPLWRERGGRVRGQPKERERAGGGGGAHNEAGEKKVK